MTADHQPKKDHWFRDMLIHGSSTWIGIMPLVLIAMLAAIAIPAFVHYRHQAAIASTNQIAPRSLENRVFGISSNTISITNSTPP